MVDISKFDSVDVLKKSFENLKVAKEEIAKTLNKKVTAASWKALYENYIVAKPEITDINMIDSIEKLKNSFTNLKEAKEKISKILNRKVAASSWQVLYDKYVTEDLYFKDKVSKYIFYLVEIEGKPQLDFLGITYEYYSNKKVAEKWHKEMVKLKYELSTHLVSIEELKNDISAEDYGELNDTWATSIQNAWLKGANLDKHGVVWISSKYLHTLLRVKKDLVNYHLATIGRAGADYITGTEFIGLLSNIFDSATTFRRRDYIRYSEKLYILIRDSDKAEVMRARYYEDLTDKKNKLKVQRIKKYKIKIDELTGANLKTQTAEFSHIRSVAIYPDLQLELDNGLIVNKKTHEIITEKGIQNEDDLYTLCIAKGWNTKWYNFYKQTFI